MFFRKGLGYFQLTVWALIFALSLFGSSVNLLAENQDSETETRSEAEKKEEATDKKQSTKSTTMKTVTVTAAKESKDAPFLPDVQGTKIYAGKKTSEIHPDELPPITNNNYREILIKTPGLVLSEETTPLVSIGYRGLNPDRAQFMQVLKDGVPITADPFGYPEAYYTPWLQSVERIDFIRGGSGLLYGPQPGGAINYVTKQPVLDKKFLAHSENTFGSFGYFSTYNAVTGTLGPVGYLGYFAERQGDGFRNANSDFEVIGGGVKLVINQTGDSILTLGYDEYHEEHGEPGGLTRAQFDLNDKVSTRQFDRFRLERYAGNIAYTKIFSEATQFDFKVYGGKYLRYSKRQNGGGFGTVPTANNNTVQEQIFYSIGFEPRLRHNYELFGQEHTLTLGTHTYFSHSPLITERGNWPAADWGTLLTDVKRDNWYFSAFIENLFRFGRLSITPSARFENVWQRVNEKNGPAPLNDGKSYNFQPLFGLGIAYEIWKTVEAYANISQSYRPITFSQSVPLAANQTIAGNLEQGFAWQYDFGFRGDPKPFIHWDISYFLLEFKNQIGTINNVIQNVGGMRNQGMELATEIDLVGMYDYYYRTDLKNTIGSLSPFIAYTFMHARFYEGRNQGRTPAYAPRNNVRVGVTYAWRDRVKLSFMGTMISSEFGDDGQTAAFQIPSYQVWDLLGEVNVLKNVYNRFDLSLFGGINNIFGEIYYARVTSTGIDPAYPRNIYGGVRVNLG